MLKPLTEGKNKFKNLRAFNVIMGVFHLAQALMMLILTNDYSIQLTTSFIRVVQRGEDVSFTTEAQPLEIFGRLAEVPIGPAVALFLILSALAHFLIASPMFYDWYVENLKKGMNLARWHEYSISSSLMIFIIALLVGFFDAPGLLLLFFLNASMVWFGAVMEKQNQGKKELDWSSFIYGCIAGLIPWVVIAWYFISAITNFDGENPIPEFVYAILASLFIFFNIFALNMYLQYKKIGPWKNYLFGEAMYIILSLVAKTALAWQVFSGTLRGEN